MRNKTYISLVVVALLCLVGWTGYGQRTRQFWDYEVVPTPSDALSRDSTAERYGEVIQKRADQGWELTAVTQSYFYFKRARPN